MLRRNPTKSEELVGDITRTPVSKETAQKKKSTFRINDSSA